MIKDSQIAEEWYESDWFKGNPDILDFTDPQGEYDRLRTSLREIALHGTGHARFHAQEALRRTPK